MRLLHSFSRVVFSFLLSAPFVSNAQSAEFKPSGNLWGYVFGDYYYKVHSDSLGRGGGNVQYRNQSQDNTNAFQIRRAYLGYDYNITEKFSAYAVLAHEQNLDASGNNTMYVKYFYLKWANIFPKSNLLIGQIPTPSFASSFNTEPLWGYRSVERTIMDMHNVSQSTDLGLSLQGKLWEQKNASDSLKPALIGYNVAVGNGTSAKPETDRFKKIRGNIYASLLKQKLTVGAYANYSRVQLSPYHMSTTTYKGYAHFKADWFRIGAEVFEQLNENSDIYQSTSTPTSDTVSGAQFGWSVFLSGKIINNKLNYFLRMDQYNPDIKFNSSRYKYVTSATGGNMSTTTFYTQTFYSAGLDWTPNPRIHIMPNLWYNQYTMMKSTDAAGYPLSKRAKMDFDLVPRITFYIIFNNSKNISNNGMNN
ncbi:MAG TPA: hypothetical protein VII99_09885 [Bacteroidia bacterium]